MRVNLLTFLFVAACWHFPVKVLAQQTQCNNFWVNPQTGQNECLDFDSGNSKPVTPPPPQQQTQPTKTPAKNYMLIFESENGDRVYISTRAIRPVREAGKRLIRFVTLAYLANGGEEKVKTGGVYYADCLRYRLQLEEYYTYDSSDRIVAATRDRRIYVPLERGSAAEALYEFACRVANSRSGNSFETDERNE